MGGGNFGSALLQPSRTLCVYGGTAAGTQCLHLSVRFFILYTGTSLARMLSAFLYREFGRPYHSVFANHSHFLCLGTV